MIRKMFVAQIYCVLHGLCKKILWMPQKIINLFKLYFLISGLWTFAGTKNSTQTYFSQEPLF